MVPAELRVRNRTLPFNAADGATLSLDFTELSALDSRFTFSRSSQATYINSSGFVAFADNNLIVNSTFGSSATPQAWSGSTGVNLTIPAVGVRRAVTTTAAQNFIGSSNISTSTGLTYSSSVYINEVSGQHYANTLAVTANPTSVSYYRNGVAVGQFDTAQPGFISMTWTASTAFGHGLRVGVGATGANVASAVCEFTAPQTSRGTNTLPTYIANESTTSAYYAPRFDYSPITLSPRGLLIEGSSTNELTNNETFGTGWTDSNITRNSTNNTSPRNDATALRVTASSANATIIRSAAIGTSAQRTLSVWLRRVSGTGNIDFTTNNGTNWTTQAITSSWVRYTFAATSEAQRVGFRVVASGDSIELWGAQLEAGFQSSSYIPTGSSTVARSRDEMTMANISALNFNQTGGTVFMRLEENPRDRDTNPYFGQFEVSPSGRGWAFARFNHSASSGRRMFPIAFSGPSTTLIASSTVTRSVSGEYKFATTLEPSVARMTVVVSGGSPVVTTATAGTLTTIGALKFNNTSESVATDFSSVWISQFEYWPTVLPSETLQSLTA
jgi:hypothetical protein